MTPFGARAAAFVRSLPDRALIDRLVRGRAWIPVLGVLLAGIVAMQVEVLKLGASMGRALQRGSALSSQNELLRASVASLADDQRIERLAAQMGMVMPAPTAVGFLQAQPRQNVSNALASIHAPDASSFLTQLSAAQTATAVDTTGSQLTSSGSAPRSASTATTSASTTGVDSGATTATQTETQTTAAQTTTAPTQTETTTTPTQTATSAGG